jgi:enoyl-CoA hydratase/carnithine racemase
MSGYQTIRCRREGAVGTLPLARPGKRNAQNPVMWQVVRPGSLEAARSAAAPLMTAVSGLAVLQS